MDFYRDFVYLQTFPLKRILQWKWKLKKLIIAQWNIHEISQWTFNFKSIFSGQAVDYNFIQYFPLLWSSTLLELKSIELNPHIINERDEAFKSQLKNIFYKHNLTNLIRCCLVLSGERSLCMCWASTKNI